MLVRLDRSILNSLYCFQHTSNFLSSAAQQFRGQTAMPKVSSQTCKGVDAQTIQHGVWIFIIYRPN